MAHPSLDSSLLVTGGARSGKSRHASGWILARPGPHLYLATAQRRSADPEMLARIGRHQRDRTAQGWRTIEEPLAIAEVITAAVGESPTAAVLVDCATLWLTNLGEALGWDDAAILARVDALAELLRHPPCAIAVVTNEVGMGVVPPTPLGRHFQDLQGWTNQRLAAAAGNAVLLVSGIPVVLK